MPCSDTRAPVRRALGIRLIVAWISSVSPFELAWGAEEADSADPITLRVLLSRSGCRDAPASCSLLKVEYAAEARTRRERRPVNIALVLDSSGSMAARAVLG